MTIARSAIRFLSLLLSAAGLAVSIWLGASEALYLATGDALFAWALASGGLLVLALSAEVAAILKRLTGHRSILAVAATLVLLLPWAAQRLGTEIQTRTLARARTNGEPLVQAVREFHRKRGRWPETLSELVPRSFPVLPVPGIPGHPSFEFVLDDGSPHEPIDGAGFACHDWQGPTERHPARFWVFISRPGFLCSEAFGFSSDTEDWSKF